MPRRRRTSPLEDFLELMSRLPWWVSVVVAVVSYVILHSFASRPMPSSVPPHEIGSAMVGSVLRAFASAGQFIVPFLCLCAALISFVTRRRRRELVRHVTEGGSPAAAIDTLSWRDFERLVGEAFRLQGYRVVEKGGAGADGGVDLELTKDGDVYLVQAKHWRARHVPVEVVRELAGVMPYRRAVGAFVVTSGRFTEPAAQFAEGRGIQLINGSKLIGLLAQAKASLRAKDSMRSDRPPASPSYLEPELRAPALTTAPTCPACSAPMVLRTAGKGPKAGSRFWGCSTYPRCRGTRDA